MGVVTLKKKCQQPKLSHSSQGYVSEGADDGQGEPPPSSLPPLAARRWSRARQLGAQEPGQARLAACTARAAQLGALHTSHICMDGERGGRGAWSVWFRSAHLTRDRQSRTRRRGPEQLRRLGRSPCLFALFSVCPSHHGAAGARAGYPQTI